MQYVGRKTSYEHIMRSVSHWGKTRESRQASAQILIAKTIIVPLDEPNYSY